MVQYQAELGYQCIRKIGSKVAPISISRRLPRAFRLYIKGSRENLALLSMLSSFDVDRDEIKELRKELEKIKAEAKQNCGQLRAESQGSVEKLEGEYSTIIERADNLSLRLQNR